jgi:hypothetical protein
MARRFVGRDSLGEALHVALRKCCDSAATSAAWNAVYLMPGAVWAEYLDFVWAEMKNTGAFKPVRTPETVWVHLKRISLKYDPYVHEDKHDPKITKLIRALPESEVAGRSIDEILGARRQWRVLFHCILRTFDDKDWDAFASFLYT